jgi:ATP-dependent helicase/nuclease subunit A
MEVPATTTRSPILRVFGASDDELAVLADAVAAGADDWWDALLRTGDERPALARARVLLTRWRAAARILPPHDLLDRVVAEGELEARVAATVPAERRAAALAAIDAVLGLALTLDGARYATPYNFVRALKRRALAVAAPLRAHAVQLLTVHGAKGLQARAVFVVDADPEPRNAESATILVDWPVDSAFPRCCAFVYSETYCAPSLEALRERELAARRREELNALYVAMTRARERLVFSATEPFRSPEPTWWDRVSPEALPFELRDAPFPGAPPSEAAAAIELRTLPSWHRDEPPAAMRSVSEGPPTADEASRLGQAVHRALEWAAARPEAAADLGGLADAAAREHRVQPTEVRRLARRIWTSPACARFFAGPALGWAGNEVVVAEGGEPLRIDRLVALDEAGARTWWVLDYKLRHAPEALSVYRDQLLRYRRAVAALQPDDRVRCAFVTGEGVVVEIDAAGRLAVP